MELIDSMEKCLSTFAAEMATSAMILGECSPDPADRHGDFKVFGLD